MQASVLHQILTWLHIHQVMPKQIIERSQVKVSFLIKKSRVGRTKVNFIRTVDFRSGLIVQPCLQDKYQRVTQPRYT